MNTAWAEIRPCVLGLFATLTELDAVWEEQSRPMVNPDTRAIALLSIGPVTAVGQDEIRVEYDAGEELLFETAVGQRVIPLRIKVDSYEQTDDATAWTYLERLRTRLRWRVANDTLALVRCAIISTGEVQDLQTNPDEDLRTVSRAMLEIKLSATFYEKDPDGYPWIETISGTGTLGNVDYDFQTE